MIGGGISSVAAENRDGGHLIADNHVYLDILSARVFLLFRDGDYLGFLPGHGVGFVCTLSSNRKLLHEVDDRI